jgi:hypothetical protein
VALRGLHEAQLPPDAKYLAAEFQNLLVSGDKDLQCALLDALSSLGRDSAFALEAIRVCERSGDDRVREAANKLEEDIYVGKAESGRPITMAQLVTWLNEVDGPDELIRTPALIGLEQSQLPPEAKSLTSRFNDLLVRGDHNTQHALLRALSSLDANCAFALEGIKACGRSSDILVKGLAMELEDIIAGKPPKVQNYEPVDLRGGPGEH